MKCTNVARDNNNKIILYYTRIKRERGRVRQTDRQTDRDGGRRERKRQADRQREREREIETDRERERERGLFLTLPAPCLYSCTCSQATRRSSYSAGTYACWSPRCYTTICSGART